ncbi:hypothetical protein G6F22_020878 [Rhizopus arrhizus]|nr:hypothetical protein G6F22_020878 [Rhizopus arrhizus]KAG1182531.1 hypothetical protein G6F35_015576 [Rhizopus arrhizus]
MPLRRHWDSIPIPARRKTDPAKPDRHPRSKHAVGVGGLLRNGLHRIPMLDDLALLKPEDIDDGIAARARFAHRVHMQDHVIAIREDTLDLAM